MRAGKQMVMGETMTTRTVHLVLVLELDGGTPEEVRAYGEAVVARIVGDKASDPDKIISMEWKAGRTLAVRIAEQVGVGGALEGGAPSPRWGAACSHGYRVGEGGRHLETHGMCTDADQNRSDRAENRGESGENRGEMIGERR